MRAQSTETAEATDPGLVRDFECLYYIFDTYIFTVIDIGAAELGLQFPFFIPNNMDNGVNNDEPQQQQAPIPPTDKGKGKGASGHEFDRGLDAGLARACPDLSDLNKSNYRKYRRRFEVFKRMCTRRSPTAISDGAYLILGTLQEKFWALSEKVDLDTLDTPQAFDHLITLMDGHFKYESAVEVPDKQEKYFSVFLRAKGETLQEYIL